MKKALPRTPGSKASPGRSRPSEPGGGLLEVARRSQWRAWLRKNHKDRTEVWLVYHKAHTGKPRISYNDAVEEALCFGWIDSTVRSLDKDRFAQRFTVRRPGSRTSQANRERLRALLQQGRIARDIVPSLPDLSEDDFEIPADLLAALRANPKTWRNFRRFSPAYIRIRIAFIEGARNRPAEFQKRLAHFLRMTEAGKQYGFGGIEKHW